MRPEERTIKTGIREGTVRPADCPGKITVQSHAQAVSQTHRCDGVQAALEEGLGGRELRSRETGHVEPQYAPRRGVPTSQRRLT
ncbi:unnamed protein product, partial [Rangifer tarandus platyrhynchus]